MFRRAKRLGACALVVFTVGVIGASTASAENFTASSYPTGATATLQIVLKTEAGSLECHLHIEVDPILLPVPKITVTPTLSKCKAFGFLSATVSMNGCDFWINIFRKFGIQCAGANKMTVVASTCEMQVGSQEELSEVALSNSGSGISTKANVSGIAYTVTKDGFLCPFGGTGAKTGATLTQNEAAQVSSTNGATFDIG